MLPGLSGLSFCEEVKKDLAISHIPVVLLTARTDSESQLLAYQNGADDFVTKPFNRDVLLARMKNLIHSRELLRERFRSQKIQLDPKEITVTSVDEKFLANALALVEANLDDSQFGALQLVKHLGMSRTLVHTKFKELTNSSTGEFIKVIRLKRACQLLKEKKFRVSEVCYMVGFSDPHYFSKAFKLYFGYPPTHFSEVGQ
jgi:AraC-like DNA-binding protein